jgi:E3 ubiquitin-protein ligase HERC2
VFVCLARLFDGVCRLFQLDERGRLFGVSFVGEDGLDWGGLYRDAISRMVEDCFSDWFDLFLPCPNNRNQTGQNMDKFLPNAKHASPRTAKMFEFFGKLVGVSMRQKLYLPFCLPSVVWKHMVGEVVSMEDIQLVDEACVAKLMEMKQAARLGTREDFEREYGGTLFTVTAANGQLVELVPGGFDTTVSWDTREQYIRLAEAYKIHEFDAQLASIRSGLVDVVPERALKLCTWQELEVLVCGDPRIDVDVMKANTTYHGYDVGLCLGCLPGVPW